MAYLMYRLCLMQIIKEIYYYNNEQNPGSLAKRLSLQDLVH